MNVVTGTSNGRHVFQQEHQNQPGLSVPIVKHRARPIHRNPPPLLAICGSELNALWDGNKNQV